ncbi:hypothetical protein UlMin_033016 [Ulmus minor]
MTLEEQNMALCLENRTLQENIQRISAMELTLQEPQDSRFFATRVQPLHIIYQKNVPTGLSHTYNKMASSCHQNNKEGYTRQYEAKENFQQLQKVIGILGDEEKRAVYDQTGYVDDYLASDVVQNLREFFRAMYKKVTEADIEEFEAKYRGSDSEKKDLIELYKKYKGNMNRLFCSMLCSDTKLDSHRFKDIIDEAIATVALNSESEVRPWLQFELERIDLYSWTLFHLFGTLVQLYGL